ncbi:MAG: Smr/MutS family protein [Paracoccaceae bacterium]
MLFTKSEKKLSDADIESWDKLKNTVDLKFNNKSFKSTDLQAKKQIINKVKSTEHNNLKQKPTSKIITEEKFVLKGTKIDDNRIDKKKLILLKKGKIKPEIIIDLHGYSSTEAKIKSIEFTTKNFLLGLRLILIITGKGKNKKNDLNEKNKNNGVLRKSLKAWLYDSHMRPNILGIIPSHINHGGDGAFYVYLKNNKNL